MFTDRFAKNTLQANVEDVVWSTIDEVAKAEKGELKARLTEKYGDTLKHEFSGLVLSTLGFNRDSDILDTIASEITGDTNVESTVNGLMKLKFEQRLAQNAQPIVQSYLAAQHPSAKR